MRHVTGNIISMTKTYNRLNEVVLACQKGIFFCHIGKGNIGLTTKGLQGLEYQSNYIDSSREYEAHRQASVFGLDQSKALSKTGSDELPGYVINDGAYRVSNTNPIVL